MAWCIAKGNQKGKEEKQDWYGVEGPLQAPFSLRKLDRQDWEGA